MKLGTYVIGAFMRVLSALPLGFHYAWSGVLAWLARDVVRYRRELVMMNLARSFPDKKYKELKQISKLFYRHFGEIISEAVWFGGCVIQSGSGTSILWSTPIRKYWKLPTMTRPA